MSNFLAVDTSGNHLAVVAVKDGTTYSTYIENCAMKHAVNIMPAVDETLQKAGLCLADCDFFTAVVGAGSFTGIRIGISTVKGFCLAYGKPAIAVTSFDVAAYNALDTKTNKILCLVDALHDCYYACGYENGEIIYPPAYLTEEEVLDLQKEGYTLVGHGEMPISAKATVQDIDLVAGLAAASEKLAADGKFGELTALYVRKSSAELNAEGKK